MKPCFSKKGAASGERSHARNLIASAFLVIAVTAHAPALAQKQGGILHSGHFDSPASMSLLEESTLAVNRPMMGVFNNLVMYKQDVAQASLQSIVPDLATGWSWNEDGTELSLPGALLVMVLILMVKPTGLFGTRRIERV